MFHPGEETTPRRCTTPPSSSPSRSRRTTCSAAPASVASSRRTARSANPASARTRHTDDEVRPLICPFESYCIGAACRFPFHGEAIDREKMLAYARDVQFDELPEPLARSMVVRPWSEDDDEELDMSAEPEYNIVTMTQVSRKLKKVKEAKAAAKAAEEAKEEDMDLTPEADDEYARRRTPTRRRSWRKS
jgi:hypothetical protein